MRSQSEYLSATAFSSKTFQIEIKKLFHLKRSIGHSIPRYSELSAIVTDAKNFLGSETALAGGVADAALTKPLSR